MNADHFDRLFYLSAAGLGLLLAGMGNLALGRRKVLRAVVTLAVCVAVLGGLLAFTRLELATRAAGVLGGVLLVAMLLGSEWVSGKLSALLVRLRRPALRWGLVAVAGVVTLVVSAMVFERTDETLTEQSMAELELISGRPPSQPSDQVRATTDRGTVLVLKEPITPRDS